MSVNEMFEVEAKINSNVMIKRGMLSRGFDVLSSNDVLRCQIIELQLILLTKKKLFTADVWHLDKETNKLQ